MNVTEISKALSNQVRVDILNWLKEPENNFPPHTEIGHFNFGVCLIYIKEKSGLSQSTISQYMAQLQKAGLVIPTRIGKWTYFKRNQKVINHFSQYIKTTL